MTYDLPRMLLTVIVGHCRSARVNELWSRHKFRVSARNGQVLYAIRPGTKFKPKDSKQPMTSRVMIADAVEENKRGEDENAVNRLPTSSCDATVSRP